MSRIRYDQNQLEGQQLQSLVSLLVDTFDLSELKTLLRTHLDRKLEAITVRSSFLDIVFEVVETAERQFWSKELVDAAIELRPKNQRLLSFRDEARRSMMTEVDGRSTAPLLNATVREAKILLDNLGDSELDGLAILYFPKTFNEFQSHHSPEKKRLMILDFCQRNDAIEFLCKSILDLRK